jgi:hypothetical protein
VIGKDSVCRLIPSGSCLADPPPTKHLPLPTPLPSPPVRRPSVATAVLAAPAISALLLTAQAATLYRGWLSTGSVAVDTVLLGLSLLIAAGNIALSRWQLRKIVRPLRLLTRSNPSSASACTGAVREIALLEQRVGHATTVPEHDVLTGLLSASGLHRTAPRELERSHAEGRQLLLLVVDIARLRDVNGLLWRVRRDVRSATGEVAGRDGTMKMPAWAVSGKPVVAGASFRLSRAPQRWLGRGRPVVGATGRPGGDSSRH